MTKPVAVILTVAAGVLITFQAPANAALAKHVSDLGAAFVSVMITMAVIVVAFLAVGHPGRLSGLSAFRPEYAIGGIGGAVIVTVSLLTVRPLGAGGLIALLVTAQLFTGVLADRFGWFGLHHVGIGAGRAAGLALVIAGTVLIVRT